MGYPFPRFILPEVTHVVCGMFQCACSYFVLDTSTNAAFRVLRATFTKVAKLPAGYICL